MLYSQSLTTGDGGERGMGARNLRTDVRAYVRACPHIYIYETRRDRTERRDTRADRQNERKKRKKERQMDRWTGRQMDRDRDREAKSGRAKTSEYRRAYNLGATAAATSTWRRRRIAKEGRKERKEEGCECASTDEKREGGRGASGDDV
ncbi:hypothetical protein HETIRDRAFT_478531 [Heterobasidion irregulare TC 32-1]|uniref:Uncharacterized protein n=1 Tax=Heterobasidion irregulare (strain TC 32-1) TaxID=747525 RepID=W4K1C8_HETIT|nr:uncharacterized protein HETIRDRAFT_478531 [Heterobasidion irregulare TC 32-1]ETW79145.1 hypothetical protein HETIRDRAFT_478531 [Heterobasidion irregulare TC 32-1]